jgi:hypothetical protein
VPKVADIFLRHSLWTQKGASSCQRQGQLELY